MKIPMKTCRRMRGYFALTSASLSWGLGAGIASQRGVEPFFFFDEVVVVMLEF